MAFQLSLHPWVYYSKYQKDGSWKDYWQMKPSPIPCQNNYDQDRNNFPEFPLVTYSTQYGLGCFEGLKAFPQANGTISLFRPEENAKRMFRSMQGLRMPPFPIEKFLYACHTIVRKNAAIRCAPTYDNSWKQNNFTHAQAMYIRPFTYSEEGIGINPSQYPWIVFITTNVETYFKNIQTAQAVTTSIARAQKGGIGWIKCSANYVIPMLEKVKAEENDFMEVLFLDAETHKYVEEGSSCNIFFVLNNDSLITPQLGDTILPGITRSSIIELARSESVTVEERLISIEEVMNDVKEVFVTGTAAGVTPITSITHKKQIKKFLGTHGKVTMHYLSTLKEIQYGLRKDTFGWMHPLPIHED